MDAVPEVSLILTAVLIRGERGVERLRAEDELRERARSSESGGGRSGGRGRGGRRRRRNELNV